MSYESSNEEKFLQGMIEQVLSALTPSLHDLPEHSWLKLLHELRDVVRDRVANSSQENTLMFQSFAFKHGVPVDADFVFDAFRR